VDRRALEASDRGADIRAAATSELANTGMAHAAPAIDYEHCNRCSGCGTRPDSAIVVDPAHPRIDYDHCKGCMVCVAVSAVSHAISRGARAANAAVASPAKNRTPMP
jgi:pyruvate ferredoxin oxidoreductase gamma subunit